MRYALCLEYQGNGYFGWQTQEQQPTVQECLESALSSVADHPIRVRAAGRTDTGVHALGQVVHFDTDAIRNERSWILGCNSHLPVTVSVLWVRPVSDDFDARFSAESRTYRYRILNRWIRPAVESTTVCWVRGLLDAASMHAAAQGLLGEHDFEAFRAAGCQANHGIRIVKNVSVLREGNYVELNITANAFLYHMVRNIVGSLLCVGKGLESPDWIVALLKQRDRNSAGATAPAGGLYFVGPTYPQRYDLPQFPFAPFPAGDELS
nr:putative tRNA pseudouridine(38-40) synthase TruA [uncultured bacterium]